VKGSLKRRRYVLIAHSGADLRKLERALSGKHEARVRLTRGEFAVIGTNQLEKDGLCKEIESLFPDVRIVTVSGTIHKCLRVISRLENSVKDSRSPHP
jgi:hypothetical protein